MNCPAGTPNGVEAIDQMTASQLLSLAAERMGDEERKEIVQRMAEAIQSVWPGPLAREGVASVGAVEDARRALAALLPGGTP